VKAASAAVAVLLLGTAPGFAETISCESPGRSVVLELDVTFNEERDAGTVTRLRAETEHVVMASAPGDSERGPDTLAFAEVASDRIQAGLESPNVGPMTLRLDIARTADYQPGAGADKDVVVAGVAYVASLGTVTLTCTGW
jgi:hypothetical protein